MGQIAWLWKCNGMLACPLVESFDGQKTELAFGKTQALYALWLWHRLTSWCLPRPLVMFDLPFCLVPGVRVLAMLALQTRLASALRVMHLISPWL
jgi:uncharacterized protein YceK